MSSTTVAILGASGHGRHHAKWFHATGCEIVAFAGTSPESCRKTQAALADSLPFRGKGYWDLDLLLAESAPQLVSVCTPPALHAGQIEKCLRSGCQVLCEKPLYWDPAQTTQQQLRRVDELLAVSAGIRPFAVNLQFAAGVPAYRQVYREHHGRELDEVRDFFLHWTPRPGGPERSPDWYWNDLGPHVISILLGLLPDARLDPESVECVISASGAEATFEVRADGRPCRARVLLTPPVEGQAVRRFGVNGFTVDYTAKPDAAGQFYTYLIHGGREWKFEDFMKTSIERFIRSATTAEATPFVTGEAAAQNLRMQLEIFDLAERRP